MASEKNKNIRRAHLLLAVYWLVKLRRGESFPKATMEVLMVQGNSLKKEFRERRTAEKNSRAERITDAAAAKVSRPAAGNDRRAKASGGTGKKKLLLRAAKRISKKSACSDIYVTLTRGIGDRSREFDGNTRERD